MVGVFLAMTTPRPTTRAMLACHELGARSLDPMISCFRLLGRGDPTYPLIACQ